MAHQFPIPSGQLLTVLREETTSPRVIVDYEGCLFRASYTADIHAARLQAHVVLVVTQHGTPDAGVRVERRGPQPIARFSYILYDLEHVHPCPLI